jgi:hypothetical protein
VGGRGRHLLWVASVLAAGLTWAAPAAHAEIYTCGTKSHFHAGWQDYSNDPNYWEGASGNIVVRRGAVCDTDTSSGNTSSAWTMVLPHNTTGWAQSGYIRWYGSSIYQFAQYKKDTATGYVTKLGATVGAGAPYQYWQQSIWNASAGQWQIRDNYNTTILLQTNFNTFSSWSEPFGVQWEGETQYSQSDVPGTSGATAHFSSMQVQREIDNGWQSGLPTLAHPTDTSSRYHASSISGNAFDLWTG